VRGDLDMAIIAKKMEGVIILLHEDIQVKDRYPILFETFSDAESAKRRFEIFLLMRTPH
jgi:hypothetical protein